MSRWILLPLVLALAACHQISHGTVVAKHVEPEGAIAVVNTIWVDKSPIIVPQVIYYPESYAVDVRGIDKKGRERVERFYVGKDDFTARAVGDSFACGETERQPECIRQRAQRDK